MTDIKTKLLFVTHTGSLSSGGEISNFHLMAYLVRLGYEVSVIAPDWHDEGYVASMNSAGIATTILNYNWWDDTVRIDDTVAVQDIYMHIQEKNPDIVVTNTTVVPWGALAAAFSNKPHIWISREFPDGEFGYVAKKMDFIAGYSNRIIANSKQLAGYISKNFNIPLEYFYSYTGIEGVQLSRKIKDTRLVSPNNINDRKNQKILIQALAILKNEDPGFSTKTILIGHRDDVYWSELNTLINDAGLTNLVVYEEFHPKPWSLIGQNDILVQTSRSESIGRTITEAMKLGVAVIAADIPGHKEAFKLGGGTLYEHDSAVDLAKKIKKAIEFPDESKQKALMAQKRALKNMAEPECNEMFVKIIDATVREDNPRGELRHVAPYIVGYISSREDVLREYGEALVRQNERIDTIYKSKAYKIGKKQAGIFRSIKKLSNKPNEKVD